MLTPNPNLPVVSINARLGPQLAGYSVKVIGLKVLYGAHCDGLRKAAVGRCVRLSRIFFTNADASVEDC